MQPSNVYYGSGAPPTMGTGKSSSRRRLFIIVGIVLIILTIILGIVASIGGTSKGKASGVSKQMISLIGEGDGLKSYELFSKQGKQSISSEQWVVFVVANKASLGKEPNPVFVYSKSLDDGTTEEAYNVGETGSIYRVKILVDTKVKLIDSITINKTIL